MITASDTNVLSTLWAGEERAKEMASALNSAMLGGKVVVCSVVFAELLAYPNVAEASVRTFLAKTGAQIDFQMSERIWIEAGLRYASVDERSMARNQGAY